MSNVKVGDLFINVNDQEDSDENDDDRVTPAGSVWRVRSRNNGDVWNIGCDTTGAWICPTEADLNNPAIFTRKAP